MVLILTLSFFKVKRASDDVVQHLGNDCDDSVVIENEAAQTEKTYNDLKRQLSDIVENSDKELCQIDLFLNSLSQLVDWAEEAKNTRALRESVASRPEIIRKQLDGIEVLQLINNEAR